MDLLRKIYEAGVVGAGGAGFPTHKKLNCRVEYFIINGAECEPLLKSDQYLMRHMSNELVAAAGLIGAYIGAVRIVFALKKKYITEAQRLKEAIEKSDVKAEIFYLDGMYPAGDEHILVYEITGRTVTPGGIPLSVGAAVSNVNTVYNVFEAVNDRPVTSRYLTVAGEVRKPAVIKAPIGTPVLECIEAAGGTALKDYSVIMGGPVMGKVTGQQQIKDRYITKTDSGIIVVPKEHYLVSRAAVPVQHIINQAKSACIQCTYCTELCPRYLIGHRLRPHRIMRAIGMEATEDEAYKEALICCECGICELYACPMGLSPRKVNIHIKNLLRSKGVKYTNPIVEMSNSAMREFRKLPLSRLVSRLDMGRYDIAAEDKVLEIHPEKVCISLRQHIGKEAVPIVACGEAVKTGQLIAAADYNETGANVHSGIDGRVMEITGTQIVIRS
jgi:Na+-translocating ferredoxin:NAD+ oxidoreductase RnfC subunit